MFDSKALSDIVQQQIHDIVDQQVQSVLSDQDWINQVEKRIVDYAQDRIAARFANIGSLPDIVATVQTSVAKLLQQGHMPDIGSYVDQNVVKNTVDSAIQSMVNQIIQEMLIDTDWISKIEQMITTNMVSRVSDHLSEIDIDSAVVSQLDKSFDKWQDRLKNNFKTNGITDVASSCNLTIMDGIVVVENETVTKDLTVERSALIKDTLTVNNLVVKGVINTDNASWTELSNIVASKTLDSLTQDWRNELIADVLDTATTKGIEFEQVTINGSSIVDEHGKLNHTFKHSSLQTVGQLQELTVAGTASLNETLTVVRNRVGINTDQPEMALGIWDEEVSLIAGKRSKDQAYLGTGRKQNLAIGVNRDVALEIDTDGLTTVKNFRIDKFRIGHSAQVPGYSGSRGDLIFNSDPKPNTPFAWICLGGFQWQPLRSA